MNNNNLSALPEEIGDLQALQALHLRDNKLQELPESLRSLKNLVMLSLRNNEVEVLPQFLPDSTEGQSSKLTNHNKIPKTIPSGAVSVNAEIYLNERLRFYLSAHPVRDKSRQIK